jgi:WD40 repeat protein
VIFVKILLILTISLTCGIALDFTNKSTIYEPVIKFGWYNRYPLKNVSFSKDGKFGITYNWIWDANTGKMLKKLNNKYCPDLMPSFNVALCSSYSGKMLKVISLPEGNLIYEKSFDKNKYTHATISPDGKFFVYLNKSNDKKITINLVSIADKKVIHSYTFPESYLYASTVKFAPNGHIIAIRLHNYRDIHKIVLLDARTLKVIRKIEQKNMELHNIDISPNSNIISAVEYKYKTHSLNLWDIKTGKMIKSYKFKLYRNYSFSYSFSNNGKYILHDGVDTGKEVQLIDIENNKIMNFYGGRSVSGVINNELVVTVADDSFFIYQIKTGKLLKKMYIKASGVNFQLTPSDDAIFGMYRLKILNLKPYSEKLANLVYKSIDKLNYVALYEFTKNFYNKFDVVQKAYRDIYNAVTKEDTLEAYEWYVSVFKKTFYNEEQIKDHIGGYYWYQSHFDTNSSKELEIISKKLNSLRQEKYAKEYELVKKENNLYIYDYYAYTHTEPKADNLQDAIDAMHKLAFKKAKQINTVSSYNTFIFAYPYAKEVKEANKLAYNLEKEIYTDIGLLGFIGKDEKMNKQARKLLIKAKKILEDTVPDGDFAGRNNIGVYMVVNRMYRLAQEEFSDTDAVLSLLESDKLKKFQNKLKIKLEKRHYGINRIASNSIEDELELRSEAVAYIFSNVSNIDKEMKQFYNSEKKKAEPFIKNEIETTQQKYNSKLKKEKEKKDAFEKLYKNILSEYRQELIKAKSMNLNQSSNPEKEKVTIEQKKDFVYNSPNNKLSQADSNKKNEILLSTHNLRLSIRYTVANDHVLINIEATNQTNYNLKGGVSLSFPDMFYSSRVYRVNRGAFDSLNTYPSGSKIWNRRKRQAVKSDYMLVEAWAKTWRAGETKRASFSIDTSRLKHLTMQLRGILIQSKRELVLPDQGADRFDQQGYPVKRVVLDLLNRSNSINEQSTN